MSISFITSIILTIIIVLTSSYPVIVDMYITSLHNVSGLLPPCITILLPDIDKRVKSSHSGGHLPFTCGVIHFPKDKYTNTDNHRYN